MILRGLLGGSDTLDAPFGNFLDFGRYLVPLGFLELYLRAKQSASVSRRFAIAGGLVAVTVIMAVGIFGISTFMWFPFGAHNQMRLPSRRLWLADARAIGNFRMTRLSRMALKSLPLGLAIEAPPTIWGYNSPNTIYSPSFILARSMTIAAIEIIAL